MWLKVGKTQHATLPPTRKKFEGLGSVNMPKANKFIMLDCTKTSNGLFIGLLLFVGTFLSYIMFLMYHEDKDYAGLISECTEIVLLLIALFITCYSLVVVRTHYQIAKPQINTFDVALEIFSLFGVYAYSINSFIPVYNFFMLEYASSEPVVWDKAHTSNVAATVASLLSIVQSTCQTLFILECLRRYAQDNGAFIRKPARELITALLLCNISLWFYDTVSAKRFDSKLILISHFGILRWSIINAFSSPIAIFYRFHSSVCLSDIWYGLYYGEMEAEGEET